MLIHSEELPQHRKRMVDLHNVRIKMTATTAKLRLNTAVNLRGNKMDPADIKIGDSVLVFHDVAGSWIEPLHIMDINENIVHVDDDGRKVPFSIDRIKRYNFEKKPLKDSDVMTLVQT